MPLRSRGCISPRTLHLKTAVHAMVTLEGPNTGDRFFRATNDVERTDRVKSLDFLADFLS